MKALKTNIIAFVLLLSCTLSAQLQYNDADVNFENMMYVRAARQYESMVRKGDKSKHVLQRLGDSYFYNTNMKNAAKWYAVLFSKYENVLDPEYIFRYVHALQGTGDYVLSKAIMKIYKQKLEKSGFTVEQLKDNDEKMDELLNRQPQFYVSNLSINTSVSDFGTTYYKDKIVFSSSRDSLKLETRVYEWNRQPYLDFFVADANDLGFDLDNVVSFSSILNTRYHEAGATFSPEGDVMYFTRNNFTNQNLGRDKDGVNHLKIYTSELKNGKWTEATEVSFNSENYSVGQPAMSPDGSKLYFVSDMPSSLGGTDIYVVDVDDSGNFSTPRNLGPAINTSAREMFPFVTEEKLYFASDGHLGFGGLDVFESEFGNDGFGLPNNLGKPLNSNKDDFAYIVNESTQRGYFSSNRAGGKGDDDIYSFRRMEETCEQTVKGSIVRTANAQPIVNVEVALCAEDGTPLANTVTDPYGAFHFDMTLDCESNYVIKTKKEGFKSGQGNLETSKEKDLENNVALEMTKELNKLIVQEDGVLKIKIDNIYFDVNKSEIRPDAAQELNKIVEVMKEYPNMVIKIEAHTDSRGSDRYNETLSDKRAKATGNYIVSQGIEDNRIESAIGYGEKQLLNQCANGVKCSQEEHNLNRRSEFIIVKLN
ncbi:OmpA family protein [Flagellimonas nanhaiensis]|uniref:Flagellar motor protein MotB n=1 Tax=Flagellimonas nanhaiensis TaxID=2292706 RepID=A0A371JRN2_9FLAO|nr:OmpA family protein [Allomuricauda nanhaiensis]RDY60170.1 flagellar motor protein MotB [Allomuricauda nanhaiensis]